MHRIFSMDIAENEHPTSFSEYTVALAKKTIEIFMQLSIFYRKKSYGTAYFLLCMLLSCANQFLFTMGHKGKTSISFYSCFLHLDTYSDIAFVCLSF